MRTEYKNEENSKEYNVEPEQVVPYNDAFSAKMNREFYNYMDNKEYDLALKALEDFQQKTSINTLSNNQKYAYLDKAATVYWVNAKTNQALELIDEAIALMPDEQSAYSTKASILETLANEEEKKGANKDIILQYRTEQRSLLQKNIELIEKKFGAGHFTLAFVYDKLAYSFFYDMPKDMEKAEYYAKSAFECDSTCSPDSQIILKFLALGDALANKDIDTAIDLLSEAVKTGLGVENFYIRVFLAIIGSMTGDYTNAVNDGAPIIEILGDNVDGSQEITRGITVYDLWDAVENAYYILEDYHNEKKILDKMTEGNGRLSGRNVGRAFFCEYKLNGLEAALLLKEQYADIFEDVGNYEIYNALKMGVGNVYSQEIQRYYDLNTLKFLPDTTIESFRQIVKYILHMMEALEECIRNGYKDEVCKSQLQVGKEWLWQVAFILYKGDRADGKAEMEVNGNYYAAKECIIALEKLSNLGLGYANGLLGDIYAVGYNTAQDNAKAFNYYKLAYESGVDDVNKGLVLSQLAFYYDEGIVTEKDTQKALEYAKAAAETGDRRGYIILGQIYADSLGDIEEGLIWLKKAYDKGAEIAKDVILRLARENIEDFDEKIQFVLDINEKLDKDIYALGTGTVSELGKKYARFYMEIEKYIIAPKDRLKFINVCLNVQVDLVSAPNGIVSGDYFIDQFEKLIAEDREMVSKIAKERQIASRISNLALAELVELGAAGKLNNVNDLNWSKIKDYYFPKALELGWDGYYGDGTGPWKPDSTNKSSKSVAPANHPPKTGFTSMDSYDNAPVSEPKSGGCYIATAVYGSYDCPEVWILRRFRDYSLAKSIRGRLFIRLYYTVSPMLVNLFGSTVWFQRFWKSRLDKIVRRLKKKGYEDTPYCD